jgi:hypothetical protein
MSEKRVDLKKTQLAILNLLNLIEKLKSFNWLHFRQLKQQQGHKRQRCHGFIQGK